jgi:apolipoprotein N-acyltransferase
LAEPAASRVIADADSAPPVGTARSFAWSAALALAGGGLVAECFLDFSAWPAGWIAFVPILLALSAPMTTRRAVALGLLAGMATNVPAFHWLVHTIHLFGGFPMGVSAFFYLALSSFASLEFVLLALSVRRAGFGPGSLYPAVFWVTLEFWYPNLFPWRLANSQRDVVPLLQIGDVTGPFGLSFAMVWTSAALATAFAKGARRARGALLGCAAAVVAILGYGVVRGAAIERATAAAPSVRLGLVQGNLTIEEKQDVRYLEGNLDTYRELSERLSPPPDVVIWPETVVTEPLPRNLEALSPAGRKLLGLRAPLFTGSLTYEADARGQRFFNSVILFDADGRVRGFSDKQILMPFGEYMPLGSVFPILKSFSPQTGDFQAGERVTPLDVPGVARFAPLNCYEDLRARIARRAVHEEGAEILFAVANDGWFGDTMAPYQHEALALWRAVENRRFLVRVTNTGVTDVVDPLGRVSLRLPVFQEASAVVPVRPLRLDSVYARFGDWFAWAVTAASLWALLSSGRSRARSGLPNRPPPRD